MGAHLRTIRNAARELAAYRTRAVDLAQEARVLGRDAAYCRGLVAGIGKDAAILGDLILEELAALELADALEREEA